MKNTISLFLGIMLLTACTQDPVRIACIGDSITEGATITVQSKYSYPVVLGNLLGPGYSVMNFGKSATTLQKSGDLPYRNTKEFSNVFAFQPDIVIIKLGTNDTKEQNWNAENFEKDYQALIDTLKSMPSSPEIILCIPVPVFQTQWGINDSTLVNGVIPVIKKTATNNKLKTIDLYHALKNEGACFPDHIHPNEAGAGKMASYIAGAIKQNQHLSN